MRRLVRNLTAVLAPVVLAGPVLAEEVRDTVVVTAARIPLPLTAAGSSITVIDREQIEARQSVFAVDLLQDVPGIAVSRSGGIGSQTQVRLRGAEANQVLVLIDGIEANDPAGNDEFGFQDLTTWDVDRIEIVRGPQSALWGSDALAGVINVITRQPDDTVQVEGFGEGGTYSTYSAGARLAGKVLGTRASLSVSRVDSDGSNSSRAGREADGYENTTAGLVLAGNPTSHLSLDLSGRYTDASKEFDGVDFFTTGLPTDTGDVTDVALGYLRAGGKLALLDGQWTHSLHGAWTSTASDSRNEFGSNGSTAADKYGIYYQTTWAFSPATPDRAGTALTFAVDHERQEFRQEGAASPFGDPNQNQHYDNTGLVAELVLSPLARLTLSASARRDDNSEFDDVTTYRGTAAWTAPEVRTRLHASVGTGQKAPTFIERFGFFPDQFVGNPALKPERSTGWEAGIEQPWADGRVAVGLTYFRDDLKDEINGFAFDPDTFLATAENLAGTSRRRGVELTGRAQVAENFRLNASYTYTDGTQPDAVTGAPVREIRRPRHSGSLNADWKLPDQRTTLNFNVTFVGQRDDNFFEVAPPFGVQVVDLGAYALAGFAAGYQLSDRVRIQARVENLLDETYEDVYGYRTPGRAAYAGLRFSF